MKWKRGRIGVFFSIGVLLLLGGRCGAALSAGGVAPLDRGPAEAGTPPRGIYPVLIFLSLVVRVGFWCAEGGVGAVG